MSNARKFCVFYCFLLGLVSCQTAPEEAMSELSLDHYELTQGFALEVIASEPDLVAPVAMTFDEKGRIWVVEMQGYMPNIDGTGEEKPNGRILILEDQDGDGKMEKTKVFLDQLVLPRALALVYGGLLYAEPPNLWFVEIEKDRPSTKTLVDSVYSVGGNVEHQPNGLLMNLDNWIYNAKSTARYRRVAGVWKKEWTTFRGQWGITQNDDGQLFYNNNSNQLLGDFVMPNQLDRNPNAPSSRGQRQTIAKDQRVYPLHATAVNRGYIDGMLDEKEKLKRFTSACGPLIYRGGQFPEEYQGNAFVCAPEANLIKRNIVTETGLAIQATQAWSDQEFLATKEESFRPVNLYNGPDGAMYVIDLHRGIIQHKTYMTAYLRDKLIERGLDTIINYGRILKVYHQDKPLQAVNIATKQPAELLKLLGHENGWVRDRAQQQLIHERAIASVADLEEIALSSSNRQARIHALWTLEGLQALNKEVLEKIIITAEAKVAIHAIRLYGLDLADSKTEILASVLEKEDPRIDLQVAMTAGNFNTAGYRSLGLLAQRYAQDTLMIEAMLSGLAGQEKAFRDYLIKETPLVSEAPIVSFLDRAINQASNSKQTAQHAIGQDVLTKGRVLFLQHCSSCHGAGGEGIANLAPPINQSEYIEGDSKKLILVMLHGLQGPVTVNGKKYTMNTVMPGLKDNKELDNEKLASIVSFVRNAFSSQPKHCSPELIEDCRGILPKQELYTEEELF